MRITIEPSTDGYHAQKVVLDMPYEDASASEALHLVKLALVAYGFHWNNIFKEDE